MEEFCAVAAQVIPLLLVVAAIEHRMFEPSTQRLILQPRVRAAMVLTNVAFIVSAEILALWETASGSQFATHTFWVACGLATAGMHVLWPLVDPWVDILRGREPVRWDRRE